MCEIIGLIVELDWFKDMNLFVAVAKAKSFTKASSVLEIPHSTLSRRITELEKSLGLRLLNRTTRHVELTHDGTAYLTRIEHLVEEAKEVHEELLQRSSQPRGHLRISLPPSFAGKQEVSWFAEFARLYPEVNIDIDSSPTHVDLLAEQFDVAFRAGKLSDSSLIVRKLALLIPALYAAPRYIKTYGNLEHPDELFKHQCLRMSGSPEKTIWNFTKGKEKISVTLSGQFWFNDPNIGLNLAVEGMGIASIFDSRCADEVVAGRLVQVLPDWKQDPIVISAITSSKLLPAKTRVLIEFFTHKMAGNINEKRRK